MFIDLAIKFNATRRGRRYSGVIIMLFSFVADYLTL